MLYLQVAVSIWVLLQNVINTNFILPILGNNFYSGGAENVLVKWFCENTETRHFLPRLPANIIHLSVTEDSQYLAVSTQDNGKVIFKL